MREPNDSREPRSLDRVGESLYALRRRPHSHAGTENISRQLLRPEDRRRSTGKDYAGAESSGIPGGFDVPLDEIEDLVHALMDDVAQELARHLAIALRHRAGQGDPLV